MLAYVSCRAQVGEDTCGVFLEQLGAGFGICLDEDVKVFEDLDSMNCM